MKRMLCAALASAILLPAAAQKNHNFEIAKNLDIFNALYRELDTYYVDTLDANKYITTAINAMLNDVDPYTEYFPYDKQKELEQMSTGFKYAGIGALIRYDKSVDRCCIDEPYEGMPALQAGLQAGDVILSIDGKDTGKRGSQALDTYTQSVSNALRGEAGTSFVLKVQRPGVEKPLTLNITRRNITFPVITYTGMLTDSIGYVGLSQYTRDCARDVKRAMTELKQQGASSMVLDLRGNGGGLMVEAINLVNMFIGRDKTVLETRGKTGAENYTYRTTEQPWDENIPLVVLVDEATASSAEITSGALQDYDRAVIIGRRTYGKGLVQQPRELPYKATLKVTTSKYYIPSGRCVQAYDFKNRNADGSPKHLPDSLCHTFYTAAGRPVKDGGGITPDLTVKPDTLSDITLQLDASDAFFHYCNRYYATHKSIAPARSFSLTDAELDQLCQDVQQDSLEYTTRSQRTIEVLKKSMKYDGYDQSAKAQFDALAEALKPDFRRDFEREKKQIRQLAEVEIVRRYYHQRGVAEYGLREDACVARAIEVLQHPDEYRRILQPAPNKK